MATLYVTEFADIGTSRNARPTQVAQIPQIATSVVTVSASSSTGAVFNTNTNLVRLQADTVCSVVFGITPSATTTSPRMAANQTEYFVVPANGSYRVSVISNT
jgi:hypothetical protein